MIASLWPISDNTTQELVNLFYSQYFKNNNPSEALYNAQYKFAKKYPNYPPKHLYPFILIKN